MSNYRYLLLLFSFFVLCEATAQDGGATRRIQEERWFYSTESNSFEPSFKVTSPDPALVGFYIQLNGDYLHFLRICAPIGTAVWVDSQLTLGETQEDCFQLDLAEWRSKFAKDSVFVVLHKQTGLLSSSDITAIAHGASGVTSDKVIVPVKRSVDKREHFILLFTIAFFVTTGFFRLQFSRIFRSFIDLNRVLSFRVRDEMVSGFRLLSTPSITIHILVSMLAAFFLTIGQSYLSPEVLSAPTLSNYISEWAVYALLILAFLLSKRFLIQIFGEVFQMRGAIYLQVFEYLRTIFILLSIALFVYVLFFYLFGTASQWLISNMAGFAIAFLISVMLLMFYKLAFETRYQKLHLFSYLCATEILPAILLIKWMFF
ncbi:MAG: DUF4271 domain-containing protein [Imperialibacter sp.]|uniref:DUF4271 domain-containing protein n=1 Tax=Imperialibacter sp. TaxID=2038411 RepID=UPI0032F009D1